MPLNVWVSIISFVYMKLVSNTSALLFMLINLSFSSASFIWFSFLVTVLAGQFSKDAVHGVLLKKILTLEIEVDSCCCHN